MPNDQNEIYTSYVTTVEKHQTYQINISKKKKNQKGK